MGPTDLSPVQNSGIDLSRSAMQVMREKDVAPGQSITREGCILVRVNNAGYEAVQPSAGGGSEQPIGIAVTDDTDLTIKANVEAVTVPAASPFTVALKFSNIVSSSDNFVRTDTSAHLVNGVDYTLDLVGGVITFNSALASVPVNCQYAFNVTLQQIQTLFGGQRSINNQAQAQFSTVSVAMGLCEVYVLTYDTSVTYTVGQQLKTAAGGIWSNTGGGVNFGKCIKIPVVGDPYLG